MAEVVGDEIIKVTGNIPDVVIIVMHVLIVISKVIISKILRPI